MSFNPYQPPTRASDGHFTSTDSGAILTPRVVEAMRRTRPWVLFIAIVGFVFGGLSLLVTLFALADDGSNSGAVTLAYALATALYLIPAIALYRYGSAISRMLHGGGVPELEGAVETQRSFWQVAGVLTIVGVICMVILIGAVVMLGRALSSF